VRRRSPGAHLEVVAGELMSADDCSRAAAGVSVVYHLAAGFDKSFAGAFRNSVLTTRNLMHACVSHCTLKRFTHVSSFAVYSNLNINRGGLLDEDAPLEDAPQERYDAYGFSKLKQEEIVREYARMYGLRYVILRPGTIFGPGKRDLTGRIGIDTFGVFMHVGGSNLLPLTYVDNCADAIVLAGLAPGVDGETFNVVDDDLLTSQQFLRAYKNRTGMRSIRLPYLFAYALCAMWEEYSRRSRGQLPPAFNRRRCAADWKGNRFSNRKLRERLGWAPRVGIDEAMERFLGQFSNQA
jgi:nucleoside-diphosphate-sugar epimerase